MNNNPTKLNDEQLIGKIKLLVSEEFKSLADLLALLAEMDFRKLYAQLGYSSLFIYMVEELHLSEIIKEAVELTKPEAEAKGLKVELEIDVKLFPIIADRQGVEIIVANLLNNAIKYNREGGQVSINAQNQGECVELKVSDTGVGIKKENLPRIFDRFYRVRDEYTRRVIGSGLGLPLVKSIVEAHSGTITVASEQHKGTTFTVSLPRNIH